MLRSLWTAASGMTSQQINIDTIANNLANVNTTGYKKESVEFKSLMYQTIQQKSTDNQGNPKPVGVQVGLGVRTGSITTSYVQGQMLTSNGEFDFAIQGDGFFRVRLEDGSIGYTRSGSLKMSVGGNGLILTNNMGNPILDKEGNNIEFPNTAVVANIKIDERGNVQYVGDDDIANNTGQQIGLAFFSNPAGLSKMPNSILKESEASGVPEIYSATELGSQFMSGYLEGSNVQAVDEMVNLIVAQRAYEMNSKTITASDEMLKTANNLR